MVQRVGTTGIQGVSPQNALAPATDKQVTFILSLAGDRSRDGMVSEIDRCKTLGYDPEQLVRTLNRSQASDWIETLKSWPRVSGYNGHSPGGTQADHRPGDRIVLDGYSVTVPHPGYYAVNLNGDEFFVRVRASNYAPMGVFIRQVSGDHTIAGSRSWPGEQAIMIALERYGHYESAQRYGILIGKCGMCGRRLTDATSRSFGIGPECRKRHDNRHLASPTTAPILQPHTEITIPEPEPVMAIVSEPVAIPEPEEQVSPLRQARGKCPTCGWRNPATFDTCMKCGG